MNKEELKKYTDKDVWYRIIERDILDCGERFDLLKILSVYIDIRKGKRLMIVNYMQEEGTWRTAFGHIEVKVEDLEAMFREDRINQIL